MRKLLVVISVVVVLLCLGVALVIGGLDQWTGMTGLGAAVSAVLLGFVINLCATIVAVAALEEYIAGILIRSDHRRRLGSAADFWDVPQPDRPWTILFGGTAPSERDPNLKLSYSTFHSFVRINNLVRELHGPHVCVELRHVDDVGDVGDWEKAASGNLIVLGGLARFPSLDHLFALLDLKTVQKLRRGKWTVETRGLQAGPDRLETEMTGALVTRDHGLVLRFVDFEAGASFISFSGGQGTGTEIAVAAMMAPKHTDARAFDFKQSLNLAVASVEDLRAGRFSAGRDPVKLPHAACVALEETQILSVRRFLRGGRLADRPRDGAAAGPQPADTDAAGQA